MNKVFKSIAVIAMIAMSATIAFGQTVDCNAGQRQHDYIRTYFSNMEDLPHSGNISVYWMHPTYTNHWNFEYVFEESNKRHDSDIEAAYDWVQVTVTVILPVSPGCHYYATKTWSGIGEPIFYFTGDDFVPNWKEVGPGEPPNPY